MAGYVILDSETIDAALFAEFSERVAETAKAHGARYLVRGGATEVVEGDWTPHRVVVLEFDSVDNARTWAELSDLKEMRVNAVKINMMIIAEGV